jgi:hypothetical protein
MKRRTQCPSGRAFYRVLVAIILFLSVFPACAKEIEGIDVAPHSVVEGSQLNLNGAGLRVFTLLIVPIKIYVAAFYSPQQLGTPEEVMASTGPMAFDFTFLRAVGQSDVTKAWSSQFAQSVSYTYPGYPHDRDSFISMFGSLKSGGVEQVQFVGTNTVVIDEGITKGTIPGREFQKSFLSLWFGTNPVSADLRSALLGH